MLSFRDQGYMIVLRFVLFVLAANYIRFTQNTPIHADTASETI